ncbi:MAG: hypothetical protein QGH40_16575 [bacterium]|jgi:Tfp pilus assembly protein PilV|nr:hypothetical protein [bacterium]
MNRGFSLLQILIALFILGVALVPATSLFLQSTRNVERSGALLEATIAARSILDEIRSQSFLLDNIGAVIDVPSEKYPFLTVPTHFSKKFKGTARVEIRQMEPGKFSERLREVRVTILWTENGQERSLDMYTLESNLNDCKLTRL